MQKAGGRVRCGRCTGIFNAHDALHEEPTADAAAPMEPPADAPPQQTAAQSRPSAAAAASDSAALIEAAEALPIETEPAAPAQAEPIEAHGDETPAERADASGAPADEAPAAAADEPQALISEAAVARVLEEEEPPEAVHVAAAPLLWSEALEGVPAGRRPALWATASVIALIALIGQALNHFRDELATRPAIGAILQGVYGSMGIDLAPRWNVHQYHVLDWVATAEPNASGRGKLVISARIQNSGPAAQAYPYIHVQLKNRWEDVVGSRIFEPAEYMAQPPARDALMQAGATTKARLVVVDPGPDAYGFELDVCVRAESQRLRCAADDVFQ